MKRMEKEVNNWKEGLGKMKGDERAKAMEKRAKEVEVVKKELKKRKLPIVGLDLYIGSSKAKRDAEGESEKKNEKKTEDEVKSSGRRRADENVKSSSKLKRFISRSAKGIDSNDKPAKTIHDVPAEGPGWKAADDAIAHAAIRGGAVRAEDQAKKLLAEKQSQRAA